MEYERKYHYKTDKGAYNKILKEYQEGDKMINKPDIAKLEISVDWHKSRAWGLNPQSSYRCWYNKKML